MQYFKFYSPLQGEEGRQRSQLLEFRSRFLLGRDQVLLHWLICLNYIIFNEYNSRQPTIKLLRFKNYHEKLLDRIIGLNSLTVAAFS